jgi:hypothetical protein
MDAGNSHPFALSLSKGRVEMPLRLLVMQPVQGFDRLSPNGSRIDLRSTGIRIRSP